MTQYIFNKERIQMPCNENLSVPILWQLTRVSSFVAKRGIEDIENQPLIDSKGPSFMKLLARSLKI